MKKIEVTIVGSKGAKLLASNLIAASVWFEVFPLPFDNYRFASRNEPQVLNAFETAREFPVNPED